MPKTWTCAGACATPVAWSPSPTTIEVLHVRGVSSRSRPLFVEWHKHRGLWRYFRKFEAARRGRITRVAVFAMIWGRFPFAVLGAVARNRRAGRFP